jgi:hypothetical protein
MRQHVHPVEQSAGDRGERRSEVPARRRRGDYAAEDARAAAARDDRSGVTEVAPAGRFNVDVKTVVPELQNSSFGAIIEVLNDVPIAVERSLYWNANGVFWAGGTNALATRLPPNK